MDGPLIKVLEYFLGNLKFDFNTPRSNSDLVINTKKFMLPIYGNNTKVITRYSEHVTERMCTPYPSDYNEKIVFQGRSVIAQNLDLSDIKYRVEDDKLILPRIVFIKKILNKSHLSAYYYLYRQQLLFDAVHKVND